MFADVLSPCLRRAYPVPFITLFSHNVTLSMLGKGLCTGTWHWFPGDRYLCSWDTIVRPSNTHAFIVLFIVQNSSNSPRLSPAQYSHTVQNFGLKHIISFHFLFIVTKITVVERVAEGLRPWRRT